MSSPMKARWTWLFLASLTPLVGLAWLGSRLGFSLWNMNIVGLVGMSAGAIAAGYAALRVPYKKWPAVVALVTSIPRGIDALHTLTSLGSMFDMFGGPIVLITIGTLATVVIAIMIIARPLPPPEAPVPTARVVDQ